MSKDLVQHPVTVQKSPEAWTDLYLEMVKAKAYASGRYGTDVIRQTEEMVCRQFVDAVLTKDMHGVLDVVQNPSMNAQGRRLFTLMTGVVLPRTIKGTISTVNSWVKNK